MNKYPGPTTYYLIGTVPVDEKTMMPLRPGVNGGYSTRKMLRCLIWLNPQTTFPLSLWRNTAKKWRLWAAKLLCRKWRFQALAGGRWRWILKATISAYWNTCKNSWKNACFHVEKHPFLCRLAHAFFYGEVHGIIVGPSNRLIYKPEEGPVSTRHLRLRETQNLRVPK